MTHIVAFTGKRGSGKNTAAKALLPYGYKEMAFADLLREILVLVYGVTMEELNDPVLKELPLTRYPFRSPRDLMTIIGTQGFRDLIDQETWVRALERRALEHDKVVITDLRFLTEEAMLKRHNATIVRVVNPNRVDTDAVSQHRSETEMDEIIPTYTIINDGTIDDLHDRIARMLRIEGDSLIQISQRPTPKRFMPLTTEVTAVQWNKEGDHPDAIFCKSTGGQSHLSDRWVIRTEHEGLQPLTPGDWIVTHDYGEHEIVPDKIFKDCFAEITT